MLLHLIKKIIQSNVKIETIAEIDGIWLKAQHLLTLIKSELNTSLSIDPDTLAKNHILKAIEYIEKLEKT